MIRKIKNYLHLLNALFACIFYGFPGYKLKVIGITGTDGKTTTTHILFDIMKEARYKVSMVSTIHAYVGGKAYNTGFHVTTPNPWFLQRILKNAVNKGDTHFILETTSHGLDQNRVWGIPYFIGIVTNITHEHLDYHKTYDDYLLSKIKLIRKSKIIIVNSEDKSFEKISRLKIPNKKIITYGLNRGDYTWKSSSLTTKLPGKYNKYNILAAYSAGKELNIKEEILVKSIRNINGITGRFETVITNRDFTVIIDFAHTPNALQQVLDYVRNILKKGRIIHVFGCAGLRDQKKRSLMGEISSKFADITIITEEDYRAENFDSIVGQIKSGMKRKQNVFVYKSRQDAINYATSIAKSHDIVLLTGKGHEKSLCRGTEEFLWSEHDAVKKALLNLKK